MARQDFRKLSPKKQALIVFGILVGLLLAASGFLIAHWPFTEEAVTKELETASASRVEIEGFWGTYFPRPGCIARGVKFYHDGNAGAAPLIAVATLRIESGFLGLFSHHVARIRAEGMRVTDPT